MSADSRLVAVGKPVESRRLKIAVLSRNFSRAGGGAERYSVALVEQLAANHDIHVFAQHTDQSLPGVVIHRIPVVLTKPRWLNQWWFATATWWLTRKGFDVVHSHENTWHGQVQTVHVLPIKYNLFHARTGWKRALRWLKVITSPRLLAYLGLEALRYAKSPEKQVVVTSESLRSIMLAAYPQTREAITVITPGITMPNVATSPKTKLVCRATLGLPLNAPCLLFVANDYRKKGLDVLLEAMKELPSDVVLAVVGNSAQARFFKDKALKIGVSMRVHFLGSLSDMESVYRMADCLVHPTTEDTFGMAVLEAMSYGLPVVVSGPRYCGIAGLLNNGKNALILSDPTDVLELLHKTRNALSNGPLRRQLSKAAMELASRFDWGKVAISQEGVYHTVDKKRVQENERKV